MKKPNFFIVGAPKSGTSAMHDYLKQHPDIWMSNLKEPQFFGRDVPANHFTKDLDEYFSLFVDVTNEKIIGESSVWYLFSELAAREIKEFSPEAKILIMLRNPVDMVHSLHSQRLYNKMECIEDFAAAIKVDNLRKTEISLQENSTRPSKPIFYRDTAKYAEQVERFLNVFGPENVHIMIYEEFKQDVSKAYNDVLLFLDVAPKYDLDFKIINPQQKIRNRTLQDFLAKPAPLFAQTIRSIMPESLRRKILAFLFKVNCDYSPRNPIDNNLRMELFDGFHPDIIKLSKLIGRDLASIWSEN